ncbi:hypothetical protein GIB67_013740, partial [Kingdonia uniflora]
SYRSIIGTSNSIKQNTFYKVGYWFNQSNLHSTFNISHYWDLHHSSSNIHALRGSFIESIKSIWQRRHSAMPYSIHIPSRSLRSTYNRGLPYNSSNILALRRSLIESTNSMWQRCHSAMPYLIHLCNIQYMSHHGRSARPVIGICIIAHQIYTLSEGRLLSQSIRSSRDAIQLCNIQY